MFHVEHLKFKNPQPKLDGDYGETHHHEDGPEQDGEFPQPGLYSIQGGSLLHTNIY